MERCTGEGSVHASYERNRLRAMLGPSFRSVSRKFPDGLRDVVDTRHTARPYRTSPGPQPSTVTDYRHTEG